MRLTTKSRHAITAILHLALNRTSGPITLADISDQQGISVSYLEQLFASLRGKGLVRGVRGPGGGYYLGAKPDQISIADVIYAVDDWVEYNRDRVRQYSHRNPQHTTQRLWDDLSEQFLGFLANITLADLVRRGEMHSVANTGHAAEADLTDRAA